MSFGLRSSGNLLSNERHTVITSSFHLFFEITLDDIKCLLLVNILQMFEESFTQVFTDVLGYQAMGIAQIILCSKKRNECNLQTVFC